ncbi:hypothetical protein [Sporichthya sp.]|uniref:hypothetical protein n=1 Tax=Sporichthya sp. TaxID=65475 RepID=UPI001801B8BF|nr:hypothetical protein [Sporichthya sp.]MBA3745356.1 hypothetical protein [Sporichthya sp.]
MRTPRWALALTALGTLGGSALIVGLPGSASAEDTRYNLEARGDAFYFEVNGDEIPASPKNDAGSLTATAETTNSGGSKGFAGVPYFGNTVQTLPGTVNGVPNQFGAGQLQIPFAVLPGYVQTASSGTPEAEAEFGYGRVKSSSSETAATSSAAYGAPAQIPAPNQQQTANASTESKGNSVSAVASGSSAGFVSGPLEVGNSTAIASITQSVGQEAKIEAKTFGRFSVSGQEFGFDQNGFKYAGQGMSSKDAISQANNTLKAAGIQIDLAPVITDKDETGKTTYTIGGLLITTTQTSPTGSGGVFQITYILGRAKVGAAIATLGFASSDGSTSAGVDSSSTDSSTDASTGSATTDSAASGLDAAALPSDLAAQAATVPTNIATITDAGVVAPVVDGTQVAGSTDTVKSLGFSAKPGQTGEGSEWLYAMLILAGVGVLGGHFLFTRFAVAAKGA